jgi:hypothetical protein
MGYPSGSISIPDIVCFSFALAKHHCHPSSDRQFTAPTYESGARDASSKLLSSAPPTLLRSDQHHRPAPKHLYAAGGWYGRGPRPPALDAIWCRLRCRGSSPAVPDRIGSPTSSCSGVHSRRTGHVPSHLRVAPLRVGGSLTVQGFVINRAAEINYPLWAPRKT